MVLELFYRPETDFFPGLEIYTVLGIHYFPEANNSFE